MVARIYNPEAQRQRQEDQKFSIVLGYIHMEFEASLVV